MKRICLLFMIVFLLTGCTPKTIINMNQEKINQIIFAIDSHEFQIKENKFEEIYTTLQEKYISKEEVEGITENHQIILKSESEEEILYIQKGGAIIKIENNRCYQYTYEENSIIDLYKRVLGNDIFYGEIALNQSYIENIEENDVIFCVDSNDVLEITVSSFDNTYLLKQEKIEEFINILNQTTYYEVSEGGLMGATPVVNLHFKDRSYWFQFSGIEHSSTVSFSTKEDIEHNDYENFLCFELRNDNFYYLLQEIMGKYSLQYENLEFEPSNEWVEELEDGKTNMQVMCERSELDICELE